MAPVEYYPNGDTTQPKQTALKIGVPFFFEYNKHNVVNEESAPVVSER
jgi:hypothetical protein